MFSRGLIALGGHAAQAYALVTVAAFAYFLWRPEYGTRSKRLPQVFQEHGLAKV